MQASELLKKASIFASDLVALNLTSRNERRSFTQPRRPPSAIMPRQGVIVLSFGNIRAVVGAHQCFLLDAHNAAVKLFAQEIAAIFRSGDIGGEPNELVFLENVFREKVDCFQRRFQLYQPIVDSFLNKADGEVFSDTGVHQLIPLKDSIQSFEMEVKEHLQCLKDLLDDDEQMLGLLLAEKAAAQESGKEVEFSRHEHVELLLGVYARQLNNIQSEITLLLERLDTKQEFVSLILAGYRNRMIKLNVHLQIATLSVGFGTATAGFFGMNLVTGYESVPGVFGNVILFSGVGGILLAGICLNHLSGSAMKRRAAQRQEEINTLTGALSDMSALDYTIKQSIEQGIRMDKETFRRKLERFRASKKTTDKEIDLIFDILDDAGIKDGALTKDDFPMVEDPKGVWEPKEEYR